MLIVANDDLNQYLRKLSCRKKDSEFARLDRSKDRLDRLKIVFYKILFRPKACENA